MSVNQPAKKELNENTSGWQPYLLWFVAVLAAALIILPLLPDVIANVVYSFHSFGGKSPKIYWYLSRASGLVSLTLLWLSMALGLGITNKMARLWPGAPSAFAVHQYTSVLGLAFAAYHGLVLIGDHFVDFSLPRLLTPFSIAYETVWVGLGQWSFYIWLVVVLSFYVRQKIGQKTWRAIHYANFGIYVMGFLHGIRSGTDSEVPWVVWYFWISGLSLVALLAYRIYETSLKGKVKLVMPQFKRARIPEAVSATSPSPTRPSIATRMKNLPMALLRSQTGKPLALPESEQGTESVAIQSNAETKVEAQAETPAEISVAAPAVPETAEQHSPADVPANTMKAQAPIEEEKPKFTNPVVRLVGKVDGKKIRIRIFGEPNTRPIPELQERNEEERQEKTLLIRLKDRFRGIPVEPMSPERQPERVGFSED